MTALNGVESTNSLRLSSAMSSCNPVFPHSTHLLVDPLWPWSSFPISFLQAAGGIGGGLATYLSSNQDHDHNRIIFGLSETQLQIFSLRLLFIEYNTLSMVIAVLSLVFFYGAPNTTFKFFICPTMVLAKLYFNNLLVTFNNCAFVRNIGKSRPICSNSQSNTKMLFFSADLGLVLTVIYDGNAAGATSINSFINGFKDPSQHQQ
ncbi:hypothetical protein C8F04DRAFT_1243063, partial [Mycena alexandri]